MAFSKWTDNTDNSMEDILTNILNYHEWFQPEKDPQTNENLDYNIEKVFEENKQITLNNTIISYNYLKFEYERIRPGEEDNTMKSTRVYSITGNIVIYTDGTKTQYIINRSGNSNTLTMLRKINNYNGKLEITEHPFKITDDIIIWMIYKVLNAQSESLVEDCHLILQKIIGFKGSTNDRLAEVKGTGNKILNLLSTLAFLFENENVSNIKPKIEYEREIIDISMDLNGSVDIDLENYIGQYVYDIEEEKNAKVILTVFLEVIPKILTAYHLDIENKEWSVEKKITFFNSIGSSILAKIQEKTNKIKKK